jgi:hypothetical protein
MLERRAQFSLPTLVVVVTALCLGRHFTEAQKLVAFGGESTHEKTFFSCNAIGNHFVGVQCNGP